MDKLYRENAEYKIKVERLSEDNNDLEKGLKEVLEKLKSFKPGDGSSASDENMAHFPTLERMLAAIEAKSIIGKYDTSLFLKAQVDNLQGRNDELRAELRETRHENNKTRLELEKTIEKVTLVDICTILVLK